MKVLVACEESQAVTIELRRLGHEAYSCDVEPCSGGHPEWHIQGDALKIIDGDCRFRTMDGKRHRINEEWDILIAHPPCTYLTTCANRAFSTKFNSPEKVIERYVSREAAIKFFMKFINAKCQRIAVENPQGCMNTQYRKPDQTIHPYYFAESEKDEMNYHQKKTCLWLKGLPKLARSNDLPKPPPKYICQGNKSKGKAIGWCEGMTGVKGGRKERAKARSKTFPGIARAMAEQWAGKAET
ncbi:hypothetical protein OBO34_14365 [Clostridiales Family XIII bacterium ASD5510]|uniref:DNA cytosine methyltransferase n=1 Tax=Hominibacterium faecale TaxID=2839743 RepID=A0A9J6QVS0_9FIRM|nr:hypothetical protein [Hominibacterium faecale]MCU7379527.1 hypothetical protein [Hominibacterium faecale]